MTLRPYLLLLLATWAILGCGARSSLLDEAGEAPPSCAPLTKSGPDVTVPGAAGFDAHGAALVALGGGPEIAVVFGLHPSGGSAFVDEPVGDVVLEPWGAWPPAVSAPHQVLPSGGSAFAVTSRADARYALLVRREGYAPEGPLFSSAVDPAGTAALETVLAFGVGQAPRFLARAGDVYLGGAEVSHDMSSPPQQLVAAAFTEVGSNKGQVAFCGLRPLTGDGVPWGSGFLVAGASDLACDDFPDGVAGGVQLLAWAGPGGSALTRLGLLPFADPVDRVRLVPRAAGGWVVAQTRGPDGTTGPIEAQGLDGSGSPDPALAPSAVVPAGRSGFATARLGEGFALAWIEPTQALGVALFDAKGIQTASASVELTSAVSVVEPLTLLAAKDASALVLAWTEQAPGVPGRVRLARFGCLPGG